MILILLKESSISSILRQECIGLLKNLWRILKSELCMKTMRANVRIVEACVFLHNTSIPDHLSTKHLMANEKRRFSGDRWKAVDLDHKDKDNMLCKCCSLIQIFERKFWTILIFFSFAHMSVILMMRFDEGKCKGFVDKSSSWAVGQSIKFLLYDLIMNNSGIKGL